MACKCNVSLSELGVPSCRVLMGYIKSLIFANRNAYIDEAAITDERSVYVALDRYIKGLPQSVINAEFAKLLQGVVDLTATVDDPVTETFSDNTAIFIREGRTTVEFKLVASPFELNEHLRELRCHRYIGVYLVDHEGRVWGVQKGATNLIPIPIDPATFSIKAEYPSATTSQKAIIKFQFLDTFKDHDLRGVGSAPEIHTMQVPIQSRLILQGTSAVLGGGIDGVIVYLHSPFGNGFTNFTPLIGYGAITYWNVYDNGSPVGIASVTEINDGIYDIDFSSTIPSGNIATIEFIGDLPAWTSARISFKVQ